MVVGGILWGRTAPTLEVCGVVPYLPWAFPFSAIGPAQAPRQEAIPCRISFLAD